MARACCWPAGWSWSWASWTTAGGWARITKLAGQVAAGVILVWSGAEVAWLPAARARARSSLTADQQTALTILLVVVTINAVNFIDGLDGLAAGIVGIGALGFFLYYYTLTKRLRPRRPDRPGAGVAPILAGMCLGFLPHNFHPARIFMGDTGSMLLGLLLAYAPISSLASLDPSTLTSPSAYSGGTVNRFPRDPAAAAAGRILLIPYADLLLAVVRRTRAGQSPFAPDKKHLHHRLLDIGHSHRASVLIMYLWAALFAGTVVLLSIIRTKLLVLGLVTLAGVLVLLLVSMPRLRPWTRPAAGAPSSRAPAGLTPRDPCACRRAAVAGEGRRRPPPQAPAAHRLTGPRLPRPAPPTRSGPAPTRSTTAPARPTPQAATSGPGPPSWRPPLTRYKRPSIPPRRTRATRGRPTVEQPGAHAAFPRSPRPACPGHPPGLLDALPEPSPPADGWPAAPPRRPDLAHRPQARPRHGRPHLQPRPRRRPSRLRPAAISRAMVITGLPAAYRGPA